MQRSELKRKKPMKRTRFSPKASTHRPPEKGGDPEYLAFVRTLPCAQCQRPGPSHAHHETGGGRGKGQKAPDRRALPFCYLHHLEFHSLIGEFEGFTFLMKRQWQDVAIQNTQWAWDVAHPPLSLSQLLDAD